MIVFHGYLFSPPLVSFTEIVCTVPVKSPRERDITTLVNKGLFTAMETSFPLPPAKHYFPPFMTRTYLNITHHCCFFDSLHFIAIIVLFIFFRPPSFFLLIFFFFLVTLFTIFPKSHCRYFSPHREGIFPLYTPLFIKRIPLWANLLTFK